MKCPVDDTELVMSERQNVEIDYCPKCRGVWLDRGELDKIIERLEREGLGQTGRGPVPQQHAVQHRDYDDDDYREHSHGQPGYRKKRRESWFGELFD